MSKALVVDDDGPNRMLLTEVLEMAGFSVLSAENGRSGLKMVMEHRPSLVLLDMKMPEMNGTEFLAQMEDSGLLSCTPVVVVSADRKTTPQAAAAVIRKPFVVSDLLETVERLRVEKGGGPQGAHYPAPPAVARAVTSGSVQRPAVLRG